MTHVLLSRTTERYGGRKSAGRLVTEPEELHHWTPQELAEQVAELESEGWHLTVTILAHKDKRRWDAKLYHPGEQCEGCRRLALGLEVEG
jgi:hypothetical protein